MKSLYCSLKVSYPTKRNKHKKRYENFSLTEKKFNTEIVLQTSHWDFSSILNSFNLRDQRRLLTSPTSPSTLFCLLSLHDLLGYENDLFPIWWLQNVNKKSQNFLFQLFLTLDMILWNSTAEGFAQVWQSEQVGIIISHGKLRWQFIGKTQNHAIFKFG